MACSRFSHIEISLCLALLCIFGGIIGAWFCLVVGLFSLARPPRAKTDANCEDKQSQQVQAAALRWLVCILSCSLFILLFGAFSGSVAVIPGYLFLAPLFATMAVNIDGFFANQIYAPGVKRQLPVISSAHSPLDIEP